MESSVQHVSGLLTRTRLFSEEEVEALFRHWRSEGKGESADQSAFVAWLVSKERLTEYQANLLKRGHTEGFFLHEYRILDRIGRGRMAGVYKAVHELGQTVAIKVLPPSKAQNPELWARFRREARLALRLQHPNVVRSYHVGEAGGAHFLVMEYLEGETLEEVLRRQGKLSAAAAVRLIYQALLGLQHLHELGLVHRDLKPANLMLVSAASADDSFAHATVKILDIGLGRVSVDERAADSKDDPQITAAGVLLGTPHYMAPEQARDARAADIRADIYSLGCVLYHCLTGTPPFKDNNLISQMIRHATEAPRPLAEFDPEVPDGLQQILNWMLAKEPAERYPTPDRAAQALHIFLAADGEPAAGVEDPRLSTYLSWLARDNSPEKRDTAALLQGRSSDEVPPPIDPHLPQPRPSKPRDHSSAKRSRGEANRPGRKRRDKVDLAPGPPSPALESPNPPDATPSTAEYHDVDLIELEPVAERKTPHQPWYRLSRRDYLMLGIGAGGVAIAILLGKLIAFLFPLKNNDLSTEQSPP
jgi:serine/threonine protein kinase